MPSFFLDLRRATKRACLPRWMTLVDGLAVDELVREEFSLFCARDALETECAPACDEASGVTSIACGHIVADSDELDATRGHPARGGKLSKLFLSRYLAGGISKVGVPNGCGVVVVHDRPRRKLFLVNDAAGAMPVWQATDGGAGLLMASQPDALAEVLDESPSLDMVSLAEFLATGRVSAPYSYYQRVRALGHGAQCEFDLTSPQAPRTQHDRLALGELDEARFARPDEAAEELVGALRSAMQRRVANRVDETGLALSGGLDSRVLLFLQSGPPMRAFTLFDSPNRELSIAQRLAHARGAEFLPLQRDPEHYGGNAELGVRLSGGMGDLGSNHFLGMRQTLRNAGIRRVVTGCYFDYLFKSLALDVTSSRLLRRERLSEFHASSYLPWFDFRTPLMLAVKERSAQLRNLATHQPLSASDRHALACARTFPIHMEGDNMQRVVTQRVLGWLPPAIDLDVLAVYRAILPQWKLNRAFMKLVVLRAVPPRALGIPDGNSNLSVRAPALLEGIARQRTALRRSMERRRRSMSSAESWPNWVHYLNSSCVVRELWNRKGTAADEIFSQVTGRARPQTIHVRSDRDARLALRLLTLKIWLDGRACGSEGA
jgi:hypothetical protein